MKRPQSLVERLENRLPLATDLAFDFGPVGQVVEAGFVGVDEFGFYDRQAGYGWTDGLGAGQATGTEAKATADHVAAQIPGDRLAFRVDDLEPGYYAITAHVASQGGTLTAAGQSVDFAAAGPVTLGVVVAADSGITQTAPDGSGSQFVFPHTGGVLVTLDGPAASLASLELHKLPPAFVLGSGTITAAARVQSFTLALRDADAELIADTGERATFAAGTFTIIDAGARPVAGTVTSVGTVIAHVDTPGASLQGLHPATIQVLTPALALDFAAVQTPVVVLLPSSGDDTLVATPTAQTYNAHAVANTRYTVAVGLSGGVDRATLTGGDLSVSAWSVNLNNRVVAIGFDEIAAAVDQVFWLADRDRLNFRLSFV